MTRIQASCFMLIASACVLAGLLISSIGSPLDSPAQAEMLLKSGNATLMTASTNDSEESLFLLDGNRGRLLIYTANINDNELELRQSLPLSRIFGDAVGAGDNGGGGR
ncbi:MAG: hypothetical protein ACOC1G_07575 [Phycisphaeraceae bacterium]